MVRQHLSGDGYRGFVFFFVSEFVYLYLYPVLFLIIVEGGAQKVHRPNDLRIENL